MEKQESRIHPDKMTQYNLFAACPLYLEDLLEEEVIQWGGCIEKRTTGGLSFTATLESIYKFCLHTRVAGHLLLLLHEFNLTEQLDSISKEAMSFPWDTIMAPDATFSCRASAKGRGNINQQLATLKLKDGVADYWREKTGSRPDVDRQNPDIKVQVHVQDSIKGQIYLDLSGESLSNRGYRLDSSMAALRENTAAGLLLRSGWKTFSREKAILIDPMCGSGTLLVEAAMIAADLPANLYRNHYGFMNWKSHDQDLWEEITDQAEEEWNKGLENLPRITGYDIDKKAIASATENVKRAGLEKYIHVEKRSLEEFSLTEAQISAPKGLIVTNPPYGVRLGEKNEIYSLYRNIGDMARDPQLKGWNLTVISNDNSLLKAIGLRHSRENKIMNGALSCFIYHYELFGSEKKKKDLDTNHQPEEQKLSNEGIQFQNRLIKRKKHLGKWLKREEISCYRLYDVDLPNFNFAIDVYENKWIHIQEYKPPVTVDMVRSEERTKEALTILKDLFSLQSNLIFLKQRRRQKGQDQYRPLGSQGERFLIREWGQRIWVNFTDYLDTGIFLDHRNIRRYLLENSSGKSMLNLFAYTCTASLMAAAGGASKVVSVDSSKTYLAWGRDNFSLNSLRSPSFIFDQSDSFKWLRSNTGFFDIIFLDPPTFSNSKSRTSVFDIQNDHCALIHLCMKKLNKDGLLIFSNNYRQFEMDKEILDEYNISEETKWTDSEDFQKKKSGHRCWFIRIK
ncbi:bifunctional 23S rRNA (guanine(2069)-N(7))-methyltransferase RlmK/23S rRNA (guanine(2445)-N(2))-methyltransferase RlmL [Oceanispirochaeta sp.]|jgi:23S rRNA (guanine2445-N2)-methyltransferase / 23S rRNA (guanine2069-N7)-methyltransferase|uniref:bifunctional 23S rRNA (guanine(2069)-N(7))-methyltransferase RlmK/23S rRNA (guanine(2445)-N(2))-methyltransferase RlmL n=1 Tax=Oceanispirochaeta sp. TaxID=2035350 RepID=UPI002608D181|nr:bifunctional 23S rRNA (guanine(2069)-N(7))-methyltransferase RlmK/23S rRNA (guanine(2445)-N(2))-methyltransferase RlmL [Oceanispirochaeta sp.]MDA3955881.1 bifunctional 23S rRNA (guanine(2069)-N(7))-methyltransferase RlmK/23S rRNA (guanine(2445)-N(2))-methyltransferase RlmL [Oceanispirochaeta sp.]